MLDTNTAIADTALDTDTVSTKNTTTRTETKGNNGSLKLHTLPNTNFSVTKEALDSVLKWQPDTEPKLPRGLHNGSVVVDKYPGCLYSPSSHNVLPSDDTVTFKFAIMSHGKDWPLPPEEERWPLIVGTITQSLCCELEGHDPPYLRGATQNDGPNTASSTSVPPAPSAKRKSLTPPLHLARYVYVPGIGERSTVDPSPNFPDTVKWNETTHTRIANSEGTVCLIHFRQRTEVVPVYGGDSLGQP